MDTQRHLLAAVSALMIIGATLHANAGESDELGSSIGLGMDMGVRQTTYTGAGLGSGLGGLGRISYLGPAAITNSLRVPTEVSDHWYLEPRLSGDYSRDQRTRVPFQNGEAGDNGNGPSQRVDSRHFSIDGTLQVYRTWRIGTKTRGFAGGQIGAGYWHRGASAVPANQEGQPSNLEGGDGIHVSFGPILGAEHFLLPALSIGLETRLVGRLSRSHSKHIDQPSTGVNISPGGSLVLRTYF